MFTFAGGSGHFLPTLPIARAVQARGHAVAYACQQAMLDTVRASGMTAFAGGGATLADPSERRPLMPVDRAAEENVLRDGFAGQIARERSERLLSVASRWRPDVIVHDEVDFGAAVAAEYLGIVHAAVIVLAAGGLVRSDLVGEPLTALRAEYGLDADPSLEMLHRYLTLAPVPESFRDPRDPLPATAHHVRPAVPSPGHRVVGAGRPAITSGGPTVYFGLGTVFPQESGDLFARVLAGLRELPIEVVATTGGVVTPAELGEQPANVHLDQFLPLGSVLPRCDAVVSHAGSGTLIGALAYGLPSVLLPLGADQPLNADRCTDLGLGRTLDASCSTSEKIARTVRDVLRDPDHRAAATRIRNEIAALPRTDHAADLLERLATHRCPITSTGY